MPEFEESSGDDQAMNQDQRENPQNSQVLLNSNTSRTPMEEALYKALKHTEARLVESEQANKQLQAKLDDFAMRMSAMEDRAGQQSQIVDQQPNTSEYHTDEEDLEKETGWVYQGRRKRNKKRKASSSLPNTPEKEAPAKAPKPAVRNPRPPPVIVEEQASYDSLYEMVQNSEIGNNFKTTLLSNGEIKINVESDANYRLLTQLLNDRGTKWYSFENKQLRPIKVMAKKLHPSCKSENIITFLKEKQFKITQAVNILSRRDKTPLPMFMLTFEKEEDMKKIYGITDILGMKVTIEPVKSSKLVPQCKNCQRYGHTQKYCNKDSRCVRCAGKHHFKNCTQPKKGKGTPPAKCVNCGENHPANYRGCEVAKEIQQMRNGKANNSEKKKPEVGPVQKQQAKPIQKRAEVSKPIPSFQAGNSYARVLQGVQPRPDDSFVTTMLQQVMSSLEQFQKKQDKFNSAVLERLNRLENSNRMAGPSKRQTSQRS